MEPPFVSAIGVDLGGTKVDIANVDQDGQIVKRLVIPTQVSAGVAAIISDIVKAVQLLQQEAKYPVVGVGVGVAGQIDARTGTVHFAPNLKWREVPIRTDLALALGMPVVVTNDVRASTWAEWIHGAGRGSQDIICLFLGTGIGGGIVSEGRLLTGFSNSAGEVGHMTVDSRGPKCNCGNYGCLEAIAGGWAIAKRAQEAVREQPEAGRMLLHLADDQIQAITTKLVTEAYHRGDPLAHTLIEDAIEAVIAGASSLVNSLNPERLILGGGILVGLPELPERIQAGIQKRALEAAWKSLQVLPTQLDNSAGVVGAATFALRALQQ